VEQVLLDGNHRDTECTVRPYRSAFSAMILHELAPPRIADRAGEPTVGDHPHDVEVLDVDRLALANQRQSLLVVVVPPGTRPRRHELIAASKGLRGSGTPSQWLLIVS